MVYDNGALILGKINDVIDYIKDNIKEDIDLLCVDANEILKEIEELKRDIKDIDIVYIDYDNGFNYYINYFKKNDKIRSDVK